MGIGDELMASGQARAEHARAGRRIQILGRDGAPRWHDLWTGCDYIARPGEVGDFARIANGPGLRPYHVAKSGTQWTYNPSFRATPAEIHLTPEEDAFGRQHSGRIVIEPHLKKKASQNKQWGWVRWNKLAYLAYKAGLRVTQLGAPGIEPVDEADFIETPTFRRAVAVLKYARGAVLPEGGLHHAAAAVGLPAVVIFGGFTPVELTGYDMHINLGANFAHACGMRQPCRHCERWMAEITPDAVLEHLTRIIGK